LKRVLNGLTAVLLLVLLVTLTPHPPALAQGGENCPAYSRPLNFGSNVTAFVFSGPLSLRTGPSLSSAKIADMPEGRLVTVLECPVYQDCHRWWKVQDKETGQIGYAAEGDATDYWLLRAGPVQIGAYASSYEGQAMISCDIPHIPEPQQDFPPSADASSAVIIADGNCSGAGNRELYIGASGYVAVDDGVGTSLQARPGEQPDIMLMSEGHPFTVTDGPICNKGLRWWEVQVPDGRRGWAADGDTRSAWLSIIPDIDIDVAGSTVLNPGDPEYDQALRALHGIGVAYATGEYIAMGVQAVTNNYQTYDAVCFVSAGVADITHDLGQEIPEARLIKNVCIIWGLVTFNAFTYAEVLMQPDVYIDSWLDPINRDVWEFPISCTIAALAGDQPYWCK